MYITLLALALTAGQPTDPAPSLKEKSPGVWEFTAGGEVAGRYHCGPDIARPHLWPINAPGGVALTRPWPMVADKPAGGSGDHPHHRSAWVGHEDVIVAGYKPLVTRKGIAGTDTWSEVPGTGKVVCTKTMIDIGDGAGLTTLNEWRAGDGTVLLTEQRYIELLDFGTHRLWRWTLTFTPVKGDVTFGDTKDGLFGIRLRDDLRTGAEKGAKPNPSAVMENAEGKHGEKDVWGHPSAWCDSSAEIDGKRMGIAMLADPANTIPTVWHARAYGLIAANPFGRAKAGFPSMAGRTDVATVKMGQPLTLRYALLVHPGDAKTGRVAEFAARAWAK